MGINEVLEKAIAKRWIAGPKITDAIEASKKLNRFKIEAMINYLGEELKDKRAVNEAVSKYRELIEQISKEELKASISVKPSQLGLNIDEELCIRNYKDIASRCRRKMIFLWLDMESHIYVDRTIELYEKELKKGSVGICIQSYLKRSINDIKRLVKEGAVIRLVKGAYTESDLISYTRSGRKRNYYLLMEYLFKKSKRFMIGTHDMSIVSRALCLNRHYKRNMTIAMLNGIRNMYAVELVKQGVKVSMYVPFGPSWARYAYRRMMEPHNVILLMRSLLQKQNL